MKNIITSASNNTAKYIREDLLLKNQHLSEFDVTISNAGNTQGKTPKRERITVRVERLSFIPPPKGDPSIRNFTQQGILDLSIFIHAINNGTQPELRIESLFDTIAEGLMGFDPIQQNPQTYLHLQNADYESSNADFLIYRMNFQCAVYISTQRKLRNL